MIALLAALSASAQPVNPHGDPGACGACHLPAPDGGAGAPKPIVAGCLSCHPSGDDHHPIGMAPDAFPVAAGWPLEDGLVSCATCHAEPAHAAVPAIGPLPAYEAANWLRGGRFDRLIDFCFRCHEPETFVRNDPHHPRPEGAARAEPSRSCPACHSGIPAQGASPAQSLLRFPPEEACRTCHQGAVHAGVEEHVGEPVAPGRDLGPTFALHEGTIACWTCHEVHQGVAAGDLGGRLGLAIQALHLEDWAVSEPVEWPGQSRPDHPPLLALPLEGGALCRACHDEGGR